MSLDGKISIITGSDRGIGFAIAREFAEVHNSTVIVCSRHLDRARESVTKIKGKAFAAELDVTDDLSVKMFIEQVLDKHNKIDILVNNAGYPFDKKIWHKKFHEISDEEIDNIMDVDFKGTMRLSKYIIPVMIRNNANTNIKENNDFVNGGVIINISSTPAISGHTEGFPYTIAKAANIALTKCIAKEYGVHNIRAYSLALGNIATKATYYSMTSTEREKAAQEPSMKRWGMPEEVAKVAACLASGKFSFATGNTIVIDGGTVLI